MLVDQNDKKGMTEIQSTDEDSSVTSGKDNL